VAYVPWQRPGFDLGLRLEEVCRNNRSARGILLGQHGLINWADDDRECYLLSLELIEKAGRFLEQHDKGDKTFGGQKYALLEEGRRRDMQAEILPWLRGQVSRQARFIGTVQDDAGILQFVNSADAARLAEMGTSCPDHFLRTKIKPLYVDWDPSGGDVGGLREKLAAGLEKYRRDYAAYYQEGRQENSPAMRDPNPTVVLVPGLGMFAWGKSKSESRVTAEFFNCAVAVIRGAEAVSAYVALPRQEAFDIEYWLLEDAKLKRMPVEKELARRVVVVIGAGSGIGREVCHRLARDGATLVAAQETAKTIEAKTGPGLGVAGSGISGCGDIVGLAVNIADRQSIRQMLKDAVLAYGGIDGLIVTAGVSAPADKTGHIPDEQWPFIFSVNVTGMYLAVDEAAKVMREQNLPGSIVLTTSVNAVVAKKGGLAYDASKAAANHLVRELALELAPLIRVNGVAPAAVVQGSGLFPRHRLVASLSKYGIAFEEADSDEVLRDKLAEYYAQRTLTRQTVTPADQAEAFALLIGERLGKTTGQILTVDGGLAEAFLR
jgi:rhamnulose-1-phosphate aldolase/alcohol dehydrogenase